MKDLRIFLDEGTGLDRFRDCTHLVYEGYGIVDQNDANLLALKGRMRPYPQASAVLRHEFSKPARLMLRFLHNVLSRRLHTLRRLLHLDLVFLRKN